MDLGVINLVLNKAKFFSWVCKWFVLINVLFNKYFKPFSVDRKLADIHDKCVSEPLYETSVRLHG